MDTNNIWKAFLVLCLAQFAFPFIASNIKGRFRELGYEMKSEPFWSILNVTNFWYEARENNKKYNDKKIANMLHIRTGWWFLVIACFLLMVVLNN